ncbi:MAG: hypothetical protein ACI8WB_004667 [Phenylobacterium sp.]|jgi:hypothetical protein
MQLGNELYFVTQMVFASKEDYEKFVTKIKVRVLFWTSTTSITDEFHEYGATGRYCIKALSPNPLPQTIINAIGGDGEMNCDPGSVAGMGSCMVASNTIMDYLLDPNGYKNWLADENNLGVNYFSASNYDKTGHSEYAGVVAPDVSDLLSWQTQLRNALSWQYGLKNIIEAYAAVPAPNQGDYHALLLDVDANVAALESAMSSCKANPVVASCQAATDTAMEALVLIDL